MAPENQDGPAPLPNPARGCGHLKRGKAYIVGSGFSEGGVLPSWVELDPPLPFREIGTEGEFTRGFQKIDGLTLQLALEETTEFVPHYPDELRAVTREDAHERAVENHTHAGVDTSKNALLNMTEADRHIVRVRTRGTEGGEHWGEVPTTEQTDLLMRAGESYYPEAADFATETIKHGLSKAIPVTPTRDPPDVVPGITRCWIMHPNACEGYGGGLIGFAYLAEVAFTEPADGDLPSYIEEAADADKLTVRDIEPPQDPEEDSGGSAELGDFEAAVEEEARGPPENFAEAERRGMYQSGPNPTEPADPTTIEVIAAGNGLEKGRGTLHREAADATCQNRPETDASTDLATAAIGDHDHTLCSLCEWPEDAQDVLDGIGGDDE